MEPAACSLTKRNTSFHVLMLLQASEMLMFNRKLTAQEACDRGLVSEVFPQHVFQQEAWKKVQQFANLPPVVSRLTGPM